MRCPCLEIIPRLAFCALFIVNPGSVAAFASAHAEVVVQFSLSDSSVSLHEPVFLDLTVKNGSREAIVFDLGPKAKGNIEITIIEPNGSPIKPPGPRREGFGRTGQISLAPGRTFTQRLLVNERYQFTGAGNYFIEAKLAGPVTTALRIPVNYEFSLERMSLRVTRRDPRRLNEVCVRLAKAAVSPDAETALQAGLTMSYINDPIVIPYLADVLRNGDHSRAFAIRGLVRIGGPEAVKVLEASSNSSDEDLRQAIKAALKELKTGVHTESID